MVMLVSKGKVQGLLCHGLRLLGYTEDFLNMGIWEYFSGGDPTFPKPRVTGPTCHNLVGLSSRATGSSFSFGCLPFPGIGVSGDLGGLLALSQT